MFCFLLYLENSTLFHQCGQSNAARYSITTWIQRNAEYRDWLYNFPTRKKTRKKAA